MQNEIEHDKGRIFEFVASQTYRRQLYLTLLYKSLIFLLYTLFIARQTGILTGTAPIIYLVLLLAFIGFSAWKALQLYSNIQNIRVRVSPHGLLVSKTPFEENGLNAKIFCIQWKKVRQASYYSKCLLGKKMNKQIAFFPIQDWSPSADLSIAPPSMLTIERKNQPLYVGSGHELSLSEAISQFIGPITEPTANQASAIEAGITQKAAQALHLPSRIGHVCYGALLLFIVSLALLMVQPIIVLAEGISLKPWFFCSATAAAMATLWYLRDTRTSFLILLPTLLAIAAALATTFSLALNLTRVLGQETSLTFTLIEDSPSEQVWQALESKAWRIRIYAPIQKRHHRNVQTHKSLNVLTGPFGIRAITSYELDKLRER